MFRKIFVFAMFATAAGYCFAADGLQQVVTSDVFYDTNSMVYENQEVQDVRYDMANQQLMQIQSQEIAPAQPAVMPVWPLVGSDADVVVACEGGACAGDKKKDNIRIVSKIGADLVVENNFNLGQSGSGAFGGWSGGANMMHGMQVPAGFDDECNTGAEMPLLHREMLETDGGAVLTASRSSRNNCGGATDAYLSFAQKVGMNQEELLSVNNAKTIAEITAVDNGVVVDGVAENAEFSVDLSADAEPAPLLNDQVRSWVVAQGQTLHEVLQNWCDKEGWDLVWTTAREYPIQASAVFKGRFVDVASAIVRNFGRATPTPYAKFYNGNRVLVISTSEE